MCSHDICVECRDITEHLEDVRVDGMIILERILKKWGVREWISYSWLRT
jgi:hypothetical protein